MKVLVVTTWLPTRERPEIGSFVARDIALLHRDHDVEVLHLSAGGTTLPLPLDVPVRTVPMSPANPLSVARASAVISEHAESADLVHTMAASALLPFRTMHPGRPWVHTEHWSALLAPDTVGVVARAAIPLTGRLLARPDLVISVGHRLAAAIRRYRRGPVVVIPNAVARPATTLPRPAGAQLVAVGGLIERKGPEIAVRTVAALRDRGVDARLIWAGDGPLLERLRALATELGIADRVDLRGRVAPERIADVLAEGDVFLLPTTMETFGVAIAEALVAGRPVVVGADGEQAAFVTEPDGVLVHEQTATAYADAVQKALAMNADRSPAEIAAAATAMFDEDARQAAYASAYDRVVDAPDVDVVIAVHDARRRIDRAVRSALTSRSVARVIVVCHGVDAEEIRAVVATDDPRAEFVAFADGIRSPAGPFNHGIGLATGRFISIVGSDDALTPRAVDAWRRTARTDGADVVIAPLRHAGGSRVPTPPTVRRRRLGGARDRLAYRTAPLGLYSRSRFGELRLTPELATGEDLAFTARMWFSDDRISRHTGQGEYVIHDGEDRVTFTPRPLAEELRAVELLIADPWVRALPAGDRVALALKLWRVSVFGAVHYRSGAWTASDREWAAGLVRSMRAFAPAASGRLSIADRDLVDVLAAPEVPDRIVDGLSAQRRRFVSPRALIPSRVALLFARDAPLRFSAATWLAGRR